MAERAPFNAEMQAYADKVKASLDVPENMDLIGIAMRGSDLNKRFYCPAAARPFAVLEEEWPGTWRFC